MIYAGVGFEPQTLHLLHSEGGSRGSNLEHSNYSPPGYFKFAGVGFEPSRVWASDTTFIHFEGGSRGSNLGRSIYSPYYDRIIVISDKKN
jgi:hypothetical protein